MTTARRFVRWFHEIGLTDVPLVGGKNASLGETYRELTPREVKIPNGFAITAEGYWSVLRAPPSRIHLTRRLSKCIKNNARQQSSQDHARALAREAFVTQALSWARAAGIVKLIGHVD